MVAVAFGVVWLQAAANQSLQTDRGRIPVSRGTMSPRRPRLLSFVVIPERQMSSPDELAECSMPPLPPLRWSGHAWEGEHVFPAWSGFQSRRGAYGSRDSRSASDGRATVRVASPSATTQPLAEQVAAFAQFIQEQDAVRDALLDALLPRYENWREDWASAMDAREFKKVMPAVSSPSAFRRLIGLSYLHILEESFQGIAYVGFECGCTWDTEHGLGFMTHGQRVVDVGGADTAFLEWIAERDMGRHRR